MISQWLEILMLPGSYPRAESKDLEKKPSSIKKLTYREMLKREIVLSEEEKLRERKFSGDFSNL